MKSKITKPVDYLDDHVKHALLMCAFCHNIILWPSDWFDAMRANEKEIEKHCFVCGQARRFIKILRSQIR